MLLPWTSARFSTWREARALFQTRAVYDRENRFFTEAYEELRQAGYFTIAVQSKANDLRVRG